MQNWIMFFAMAVMMPKPDVCAQGLPDSVKMELKKAVDEFRMSVHSPGIAVALIGDSIEFEYASGYMDDDDKRPMTAHSKMPVMSVTKVFTATMLMQLVEKRKVGLHDKLVNYIPEYKVKSHGGSVANTTLYQLASHTSGLPRNTPAQLSYSEAFDRWMLGQKNNEALAKLPTNAAMLRSLEKLTLEYPAFDDVHHNDRHYSNLGYSLLGIALERASKTDYKTYVRQNILEPLRMGATGFINDEGGNEELGAGYRFDDSSKKMEKMPMFRPYSALYAGGVYSTVRDLAKFVAAHYSGGQSVLNKESRYMMRGMKIAWRSAYPYVLHEGAMPGYRSIVVLHPKKKFGWVVLCNVQDVEFNRMNELFAKVGSVYFGNEEEIALKEMEGTYVLQGGERRVRIEVRGGKMYGDYLSDIIGGRPLMPDGRNAFKVTGGSGYAVRYEFVGDGRGKVRAMKMGQYVWLKE